jgi:hypothetical protein
MKNEIRLVTLIAILILPLCVFSQSKLEFTKESEELGIMYVDELELTKLAIEFTNTGDQPLVITTARGCCGTRIVDWPNAPILPGEKGIVNIEFRLSPRAHSVSRTVSVLSNDPEGMKVFRIKGEVMERQAVLQPSGQAGPRVQ